MALLLTLTLLGSQYAAIPFAQTPRSIVILISIDGWRWDYLDRHRPPAIGRLAAQGVRAEGLVPVFPSKTFPNHYTIVTGQYPHRHGIVSNNMVDPLLPGRFSLSNRRVQQDTRWWGAEPLWVTAERQGQISATMFWPGSDVEIAGRRPLNWRPFENKLPNHARVDQLLSWLRQPEPKRPTFLTLYFSTIDSVGHDHGPDSPQLAVAIQEIDQQIARIVAEVEAADLAGRTNFILVSDHGMAPLSPQRMIVLDDYLEMTSVDLVDSSPIAGINPRRLSAAAIYKALKDKHPSLEVFMRDAVPAEYRLRDHPRIAAVIGIADNGWHITTRAALADEDKEFPGGTHGYDPRHRSMHGLFIASGPRFQRGLVVPAFENVHVYELMCRVLGLEPASNDGDPKVTASFLR